MLDFPKDQLPMTDPLNDEKVEDILRIIRSKLFRVNACWQRRDGWWQAQLRSPSGDYFFNFAIGGNMHAALTGALEKAEKRSHQINIKDTQVPDDDRPKDRLPIHEEGPETERSAESPPVLDDDDLLGEAPAAVEENDDDLL